MSTLSEILHPMIRAIVVNANRAGVADVTWPDGERIRVRYDTLLGSDDNDDGVEECVVDVLQSLVPGPRASTLLIPGHMGTIRSTDPPAAVAPAAELPEPLGKERKDLPRG